MCDSLAQYKKSTKHREHLPDNIQDILYNQKLNFPKTGAFLCKCLSLVSSPLLWLVQIQRGESIRDDSFSSLTLNLPLHEGSGGGTNPLSFNAFSVQSPSELCTLYNFCIWPLVRCNSALVLQRSQCRYAFITSAPAVNLWEQTAVYCFGGDWVKISNRLIPQRDNTTNITVIHQKKVLDEQSLHWTFYFSSNNSAANSNTPVWDGAAQVSEWMVLMVIHAVTCCWKTEF